MYEKLLGARSVESAIEIQTDFAKEAYEGFVAQATKVSELYTRVRHRRSEAGHHGLREHTEVIYPEDFPPPRAAGQRPSSQRRRRSSAGFLFSSWPLDAVIRVKKRNREGMLQVACEEALARDE